MATIKLKRGFDLNLKGNIGETTVSASAPSAVYGIVPDDFPGLIPRLDVKVGDKVLSGDAVFHDKTHEDIFITSPVTGIVKAINRGERRKILSIVITPEAGDACATIDTSDVKAALLRSGLWAMLRQRPYDVVPDPNVTPRDIFVTAFDSAPLAPDLEVVLGDKKQYVDAGVEALATLTEGNVHIGCRPGQQIDADGAEVNIFDGPHPAGNAGIQIANVKPVNKGETVWTLDIVTLARIGRLMKTGKVDFNTVVAITGECVEQPRYVSAVMGCEIKSLLADVATDGARIISGNVLTGVKTDIDGYLMAPYRHVTVIPELGKEDEFMGWASLNPKRFSLNHSFTTWLAGKLHKPASFDARLKGGERAIVMAGEYDSMIPMDIYAEFLIKAIIAFDIDKMEQLGIYEIAPEDFALAEFVDTSKIPLQHIVREGLDKMRKEMS